MLRKLKLLYERLTRIGNKQKLKWATASLAIILSASVAKAGFTNPVSLSGFSVGYYAAPAFADLDDDGDLDIVIGNVYGDLWYFQNNKGIYTELTGTYNPFNGFDVGDYSTPALGDVDNDGDMDLVVGEASGYLHYFQNDGTGVFTEIIGALNPFDLIDVGSYVHPTLADVDNDGDLDLVIGDNAAGFNLYYFQNNAVVFTQKIGAENPFGGILAEYTAAPSFADFDHDGDLDLFFGDWYGYLSYYRNDAGSFVEQTGNANPFDEMIFYKMAAPVIVDVDLDGDFDAVVGNYDAGILRYLRNDAGTFAEKRGTFNPFEGILLTYSDVTPVFADINGDDNLDLVIGNGYGTISYFKDTLNGFIPKVGVENPFDAIDVGDNSTPAMGDVDNDGDLDLFIGEKYGAILYYKNDAGTYVEQIGANNPLNGVDVGDYSAPALGDIDDDGDLDLVITEEYGNVNYFRNDAGVFIETVGVTNPFFGISTGADLSSPALIDYDNDGDLDLYIGLKYNASIVYYKNDAGVFTQQSGVDNPVDGIALYQPAPAFADIDGDGDLDLYIGSANIIYLSEFMVPGITASQTTGLITTEAGGTDMFTLVLNSPPDDDVIITLISNKPSEGTVSPGVLTFTPANWDVHQIVTLTGVDDNDDDGNQNYHISFAVASTDAEYDGIVVSNVNATNTDNDGPTSVEPVTAGGIKVYSVDHSIMLVSEDQIIDKVNVYDLSGQLIIQKNIGTTGTYELFVPGGQSGVYVVQTFTEDEVLRTKVIIP